MPQILFRVFIQLFGLYKELIPSGNIAVSTIKQHINELIGIHRYFRVSICEPAHSMELDRVEFIDELFFGAASIRAAFSQSEKPNQDFTDCQIDFSHV